MRDLFRRYAEHGSAARLVREMAVEGRTTKAWVTQDGRQRTGRPIDQQCIFAMLRNRIYLGEIRNKGHVVHRPARSHRAAGSLDAAHAFVERRKQAPRETASRSIQPLLAGLLFAPMASMLHTFVRRTGGRYRYVPYLHKRRNAGATLSPDAP